LHRLAAAIEEQFSQLLFECLDLQADGGLGEVEFVRRAGETASPGDLEESSELMSSIFSLGALLPAWRVCS